MEQADDGIEIVDCDTDEEREMCEEFVEVLRESWMATSRKDVRNVTPATGGDSVIVNIVPDGGMPTLGPYLQRPLLEGWALTGLKGADHVGSNSMFFSKIVSGDIELEPDVKSDLYGPSVCEDCGERESSELVEAGTKRSKLTDEELTIHKFVCQECA